MGTLTLGTTNLSASGGNWSSAPAGTVVQSATTTASGAVATSSDGPNASGLITTLTPRLSGSKFLTILSGVTAHSNKTSADNHGTIYYMYVSVAGGSGTQYFHHDGHSAAASQVYNLSVLEIAS